MTHSTIVAVATGATFYEAMLPGLALTAAIAVVLPWLDRSKTIVRATLLGICLALMWRYMIWRIVYTLPPIQHRLDFVVGVIFATVEALSMVGTTIALTFLSRTRNRSAEADEAVKVHRQLPQEPLIDVLICTYNEEEAILARVIDGAKAVQYGRKRVWVLDDGKRAWLKALCERKSCNYLTRNSNAHAKAGNINNGLHHLAKLAEPPDFVAVLDADFVCLPQFLTRTCALMGDPKVGVVQTPQHFSNADPIQENLATATVWPDEQRFFFDVIMASKDAWDAAFCCGTSSLLRFSALMQIGGFPTDSVTEDYLVSLRLREIGYNTIYLNEKLSVGLAPEGLKEYVTQRSRWCLGFVQICMGPSGPLRIGNGVPLVDRLMLIETFLHWGATHSFRILGLVVPSLYLILDIQAVYAGVTDTIDHIFPFFIAQVLILGWLTEWRVLPILADLSQLLSCHEIIKAVFAGLLRPKGQKFKVTAKGGDRGQRFVQWPMLRNFLFYLSLTVVGILWTFVMHVGRPLADSSSMALFWSWYNLIVLVLACFVCIEQPRSDAPVVANNNQPRERRKPLVARLIGARGLAPDLGDGLALDARGPALGGKANVGPEEIEGPASSTVKPIRVMAAIAHRIFR